MTDDKKNETQDMTPAEETLSSPEAAPDAWQEELPPEDDFQSGDELSEDMVEDVLPADEVQSSQAAGGRSGKGIVVAVLLFGAALIGGLAYLQFSGGSEKTEEGGRLVPIASQINIKEIRDAAKQVKVDPKATAATDATGKVDMTALFHQAQEQAAQHAGSALPLREGESPEPTESPSSVEKTGAIVSTVPPSAVSEPMPPPPLVMPEETKIAKVETIAVKKEEVATVASDAKVQADERIKALEAKIGGLTDELAKASEKNAELLARVEELQKTSEKAAEAEALKARIAELEQKLQAPMPAAAAPRREKNTSVSINQSVDMEEASKPAKPAPVKRAEKKVVAKKKAVEPAAPSWVLRAATPEAVWVSTTRDGADLRQVTLGQTLTGVGKIKEIKQIGDKWEVIGDKGSLK